MTSTDATTWTTWDTTTDQGLFAVSADGGDVVAVQGTTHSVRSESADASWTAVSP